MKNWLIKDYIYIYIANLKRNDNKKCVTGHRSGLVTMQDWSLWGTDYRAGLVVINARLVESVMSATVPAFESEGSLEKYNKNRF